jgi:hypothetical protein
MNNHVKGLTLLLPNPSSRRSGRLIAATLLAAAGLAATAPHASAGGYATISFDNTYSNSDGWTAAADARGGGYVGATLSGHSGTATWNISGGRSTFAMGEYTTFRYHAPPNVTLTSMALVSEVSGLAGGDWNTIARDASHEVYDDVPSTNGARALGVSVSGDWAEILLQCGGPHPCYANADAFLRISGAVMGLSDPLPPQVGAVGGTLATDDKLKDTEHLAFPAADAGSGLYVLRLYDGSTPISVDLVDANGGHCAELGSRKYDRAVPCRLAATATTSLDTTRLADGNHTLKAVIEDASGNTTLAWGPTQKLVANHPPVNTAVPAIDDPSEAAKYLKPMIGLSLAFPNQGTWNGPSISFAYGWLRCDVSGGGCVQIPGATTLGYTPTSDDIGHRLKLGVTATNVADTVTAYSVLSGTVTAPKSADPVTDKPTSGADGANGASGANGVSGSSAATASVTVPGLPGADGASATTHTVVGHVVGLPLGTACPGEKATLKFQHVAGGQTKLGYGKASTAQLELTCTTSGRAIADAKLEIATKTGAQAAVASDVATDGAGHATLRLAKGASRAITVGYRMYSDDTLARATATLKVLVKAKLSIRADRKHLHNGQAVTLRGALAGGLVPKRGVSLAVQWKDGKRWRPFAQIKTNRKGRFAYAYKFTRTNKKVAYRLRVQIVKGQIDYPYVSTSSKSVRVTVAP